MKETRSLKILGILDWLWRIEEGPCRYIHTKITESGTVLSALIQVIQARSIHIMQWFALNLILSPCIYPKKYKLVLFPFFNLCSKCEDNVTLSQSGISLATNWIWTLQSKKSALFTDRELRGMEGAKTRAFSPSTCLSPKHEWALV